MGKIIFNKKGSFKYKVIDKAYFYENMSYSESLLLTIEEKLNNNKYILLDHILGYLDKKEINKLKDMIKDKDNIIINDDINLLIKYFNLKVSEGVLYRMQRKLRAKGYKVRRTYSVSDFIKDVYKNVR